MDTPPCCEPTAELREWGYEPQPTTELDDISVSDLKVRETVKEKSECRVLRVTADADVDLYLVDPFTVDSPSETRLLDGAHGELADRYQREFSRRKKAYEYAQLLGVPVLPHLFGDGWILSVAGPDSIQGRAFRREFNQREGYRKALVDGFARLIVLGHSDLVSSNMLITEDGRFTFIDLYTSTTQYKLVRGISQQMGLLSRRFGAATGGMGVIQNVLHRAIEIAECCKDNADGEFCDHVSQQQNTLETMFLNQHNNEQ